jgi:hypothetical protein
MCFFIYFLFYLTIRSFIFFRTFLSFYFFTFVSRDIAFSMVAQDSQGFYGHDDLLSLSLFFRILFLFFKSLFRTLITFLILKEQSYSFQNRNNNKIKTKRTKFFYFNFLASFRCFRFR